MDVGLFLRFGGPVPGREQKAIDLFTEAQDYWSTKLAAGSISYFEPFLFFTSGPSDEAGFILVKGPAPEIFKMIEEDEFKTLTQKAFLVVESFGWDLLTTGEEIMYQFERSVKARAELGLS